LPLKSVSENHCAESSGVGIFDGLSPVSHEHGQLDDRGRASVENKKVRNAGRGNKDETNVAGVTKL
jgi:hypothetical protein